MGNVDVSITCSICCISVVKSNSANTRNAWDLDYLLITGSQVRSSKKINNIIFNLPYKGLAHGCDLVVPWSKSGKI